MPTSLYALYPSKLQLVAIQLACPLPPDRVSLDGELLPPTESIKKKNSKNQPWESGNVAKKRHSR